MILGTAGHIDHGKTALVKALTGVDTDRLPEEKRRGITIDLGFAPLELSGVGTIGIVDVPGHEAFVRTMLAGASGIDIALLVIAADEGVMPQTREHLEILSLLGIPKVLVALTKSDLVSDEWRALVTDDARALLADTPFAGSEIISVSSVTGAGIDQLREAIALAATVAPGRSLDDDLFRLPIDRVFTMKGTGTVVTGTVWTGNVGRDAVVTVFPPGRTSRVRGIQHHGKAVKSANAGERIALALQDLDVSEISRGSTVVAGGEWTPTSRVVADLHIETEPHAIGPRTRLRFHLGTADVGARLTRAAANRDQLEERLAATIVLEEPLLVRGGDRFVLRLPSPAATIGGGVVIDPFPPTKQRRKAGERDLASMSRTEGTASESHEERLVRMVIDAGVDGISITSLPVRLGVSRARAIDLVQRLQFVEIEDTIYHRDAFASVEGEVERMVQKHAENSPLEPGVQLHSVRSMVGAPDAVIDLALARLVEASRIEIVQSVARPAGWSPKLGERDKRVADSILHEICVQPDAPPAVSELVGKFGEKTVSLLRYLERSGELIRVSDERYYAPGAVAAMVTKLRASLEPGRIYNPAELRTVLGVSRKYLIPFLEFCDVSGVTERKAEGRVIVIRQP